MSISVPTQLAEFVQHQVSTGQYGSASEVARTGLRILFEREQAKAERRQMLQDMIRHSRETGGPSIPADEVHAQMERLIAKHAAAAEGEQNDVGLSDDDESAVGIRGVVTRGTAASAYVSQHA